MLGERLSKLRLSRNLTQQQLADSVNISRGTYAQYEINRREPDNDTLSKLAAFFEVSIDYLVTGKHPSESIVSREEEEFLKWVDENLESSFFYDFSKSPEESKREMMETLKFIWEREKKRQERDKPAGDFQ